MTETTRQGVAHMVYFTLHDGSDEAQKALLDDCNHYLADHPGVVHYSAGIRGDDFVRPVNDSEFHVALVVIFEDKQTHDTYQQSARHLEFIERNKAKWKQVRVFDAYIG